MNTYLEQLEQLIREFEAQLGGPLPKLRSNEFALANCQGNLIRGYNMAFLRHLVVRVGDPTAARKFLRDVSDESTNGPHVTTGRTWETDARPDSFQLENGVTPEQAGIDIRHASEAERWNGKPATCLNVGITAMGLKALGLDDASYNTFPEEFREGAAMRATKVGDVDGSDPKHWRRPFNDKDTVHLMWTVHSGTKPHLEAACRDLEDRWNASGAFVVTGCLDGAKLPDKKTGRPGHDVHFGYRDDIAQPRFQMDRLTPIGYELSVSYGAQDNQPPVPAGALLQSPDGATSFDEVRWQMPALVSAEGDRNQELSQYGCYNAFRVMKQDVVAFEDFLEQKADEMDPKWNKEYLAAKLMGRWRNGVPIVKTPEHETWSEADLTAEDIDEMLEEVGTALNQFDYASDYVVKHTDFGKTESADGADEVAGGLLEADGGVNDPRGTSCPIGSHIRRSNPRRGLITQRSANHTRQIVRRGMPYGPPVDPRNPDDGIERGLLGSFFCGSLLSQFESMMYDWINMGLQDPRITGTNCPIIGANKSESSRFDIFLEPHPDHPDRPDKVTIRGFPRFVETVGAAYFFYPGLPGLRLLGYLKLNTKEQ